MNIQFWLENHYRQAPIDKLRLGQRFVDDFIEIPWPELFYETNEYEALYKIITWLSNTQYFDKLPQKMRRENESA